MPPTRGATSENAAITGIGRGRCGFSPGAHRNRRRVRLTAESRNPNRSSTPTTNSLHSSLRPTEQPRRGPHQAKRHWKVSPSPDPARNQGFPSSTRAEAKEHHHDDASKEVTTPKKAPPPSVPAAARTKLSPGRESQPHTRRKGPSRPPSPPGAPTPRHSHHHHQTRELREHDRHPPHLAEMRAGLRSMRPTEHRQGAPWAPPERHEGGGAEQHRSGDSKTNANARRLELPGPAAAPPTWPPRPPHSRGTRGRRPAPISAGTPRQTRVATPIRPELQSLEGERPLPTPPTREEEDPPPPSAARLSPGGVLRLELWIFPSVAVRSFRKPIMISSPPAAFRSSSLFRSSMARARYTFFTLLMRLFAMVEASVRVIKTFHFASSSVPQCARNLIKCIINLNHRTISANSLLYGRRFYFVT
ncbi:uncharacterized protein [Lolium perenne]|uniref:uncharacterized protein n=1 Tax=Lolium perenne TaxID=4522 RepID=UPI003A990CD4